MNKQVKVIILPILLCIVGCEKSYIPSISIDSNSFPRLETVDYFNAELCTGWITYRSNVFSGENFQYKITMNGEETFYFKFSTMMLNEPLGLGGAILSINKEYVTNFVNGSFTFRFDLRSCMDKGYINDEHLIDVTTVTYFYN